MKVHNSLNTSALVSVLISFRDYIIFSILFFVKPEKKPSLFVDIVW